MKILFTFENPLSSIEADAEVFVTTAKYLAPLTTQSWLHVPASRSDDRATVATKFGIPVLRAVSPARPAALRHFCCGLSLVFRREFRQADLVYTRNLWIAWLTVLFGQRVVFDHYRPWPAQIPPLRFWIYRLLRNRRFLINICHSNYVKQVYLDLGIAPDKLQCVHNGFEPRRLQPPTDIAAAKRQIGVDSNAKTVVYTGRINHKKGLALVIEAARRLPQVLFILVGSYGEGPIEKLARSVANVHIVAWQPPEALRRYIFAADILLIPPSSQPLAIFGSTVLPLKVFLYMASGHPIVAGDTPDVREVLRHGYNAILCRPDSVDALVTGIGSLTTDPMFGARLAAAAQADSHDFTWTSRANKIARIVADRLQANPSPREGWGSAHYRAWLRQSLRWLSHLIRKRSWVLPPD
jgi:glycosyltransferase involved in cell wall biosynthesis